LQTNRINFKSNLLKETSVSKHQSNEKNGDNAILQNNSDEFVSQTDKSKSMPNPIAKSVKTSLV